MKLLYTLTIGLALLAFPERAAAQQDPTLMAEGARVWANNCTRCHNARSSMEHNDREWITIVAHMRARANLTRSEGRAVAEFLKATNAPESVHVPPTPVPTGQAFRETEGDGKDEGSNANPSIDTKDGFLLSDHEIIRLLALIQALK